MNSKHKELLEEYLVCIYQRRYYDAHEALEEIWFPRRFEKDDEMNLLKGFINASVSFELIKLGREKPSKTAWKTYLKYRPLLYKVKSPFLNDYHKIARIIEEIKNTKSI